MSTLIRSMGMNPSTTSTYIKRATATLSDGSCVVMIVDPNQSGLPAGSGGDASNVTKTYIYWSADRVSWTLKNTITTQPFGGIVASMTVDASDNIHIAYRISTGALMYNKLTHAAGNVWSVGTAETVLAAQASATYVLRIDIDVVFGTNAVVIAAWGFLNTGPQNYIRCFVRATSTNTWIAQTQFAIMAYDPYSGTQDISVAVDSSGVDGSNNFYYAVSAGARKNSVGTDFGDVIVMFKSTATTGAYISATVIIGSVGSGGIFQGQGAGIRKYWIYSTAAHEFTMVGYIGGSTLTIPTYRWTYASGVLVATAALASVTTTSSIKRPYAYEYATTAYGKDCALVVGIANSDPFGQLVKFARGTSSTAVSISPYYADLDDTASKTIHGQASLLFGGGNENNDKNNLDFMFFDWSSSLGIFEMRHQYDLMPNAPTAVLPGQGSTVSTDRPALSAEFRLKSNIPQLRVKERWQLSTDPGFTAQVKDFTQPDTAFTVPSGTKSAAVHITTTSTLDALSELFQGTWYVRSATIDENGDQGPWSASNSFTVSHAPSAANLYPNNDKVYNYGASGIVTFSWSFTDPSPFDVQTAYQIIIERVDTGVALVDTGKLFLDGVQGASSTSTLAIPLGGKNLQLRWKIRLWDSDGVPGPYSTYQTFYTADPPGVTINTPAGGSTVTTGNPVVSWTFTSGGGIVQKTYRVVITSAGGIVYDSGTKNGTTNSYTIPVGYLKNSTPYTLSLYVRDNLDLDGSASTTFQTAWTPPAAPSFTVSNALYQTSGFTRITWTNSTIDADFIAYRVYRRPAGATAWEQIYETPISQSSYTFDYWLSGSGQSYDYTVTQIVDRFGDIVESVPVATTSTGTSESYWLIHLTDNTKNFLLYNVNADSFSEEFEQESYHVIGRGRHVDYGERLGYTGQLSAQIRDKTGITARQQRLLLEDLKNDKQELFIRNPFGDVWRVAASDISVERVAGVGASEFVNVTIPYVEVGF